MGNRLLFGGIDTDSAPHAIDNGALINSVNVRTIVSDSQNTTDVQLIEGNVEKQSVRNALPDGYNTLVGKCVDQQRERIYLFFHNINGNHCIVRYVLLTDVADIILQDSWVNEGLGWSSGMYIDARVTENELIWVAEGLDPMYFNFNFAYVGVQPFSQSLLTLINEPPVVPLECERASNSVAFGDIQFIPLQFTYRFVTVDNSYSVIAPYSLTQLPVRQSEIKIDPQTGNSVDVEVDFDQKIPANWKTVEFIVRFVNGNSFSVIKQFNYDVVADVIAVNNHNSGVAQLGFTWLGNLIYNIDSNTAARLFDNVPISSKALELAGNRLFLANNIEGYTTPNLKPGYSTSTTDYTVDNPTSTTTQSYIISAQKAATSEVYFAVIIRSGSKNYLLPKDCSIGHITPEHTWSNGGVMNNPGYLTTEDEIWTVPDTIARDSLIELKEQGDPDFATLGQTANAATQNIRYNIVAEANNVDFHDVIDLSQVGCFTYKEFELVNEPSEFGPSNQSRALLPNGTYNLGIDYYDSALRKCGVQLLESFNVDPYGPISRQLSEKLDFTINNTVASIPDFAHHYAITLSKQQKSQRIIQFIPNIIKVALQSNDGSITLSGYQNLTTTPIGSVVYGLAIPIENLVKYSYGYAYNQGDYVELVGLNAAGSADTSVIKGFVKQVLNGYVLISYDSSKLSDLDRIVPESTKYVFESGATALTSPPYDVAWDAWQCELISTPAIYSPPVPNPQPPLSTQILTKRQSTCVVTIYSGLADPEMYEVAKFGEVLNPGNSATFGDFYDTGSLTTALLGDHYTQVRTGAAGALTCVSITTYDPLNEFPVNDTGRITQIDRIGQNDVPTIVRFSNTNTPGTKNNGYRTFDALDYRVIEETAGDITYLAFTSKGIQEGGQLIILCSNGSFTTLVGKQQVYGSNQDQAFVISSAAQVLGDINPIKGNWACISPRSVNIYQGKVWWVDYKNRDIIEFGDGGANPVSQFKGNRLWKTLLKLIPQDQADLITAGVNPFCSEYLISVPAVNQTKSVLPTTTLPDPFDAVYYDNRTYIYNWQLNKWIGSYENGGEFMNVADRVFCFKNVNVSRGIIPNWQPKFYEEFVGTPGNFFGDSAFGIFSVPFNEGYPNVKTPNATRLSCNRAPDQCWIKTDAQKFGVQVTWTAPFIQNEGDMMAQVLRNRLSNNAATSAEYDQQGIMGDPLKGKTVLIAYVFNSANGAFYASSAGLNYQISSGH